MTKHFTHPSALCESSQIGAGTRIWAFAHILPGARIGEAAPLRAHARICAPSL